MTLSNAMTVNQPDTPILSTLIEVLQMKQAVLKTCPVG